MAYNAVPNKPDKYKQGRYILNEKTAHKYISDPEKIYYRSSLEYKFCKYMETCGDKIIKWGSEVVSVPYIGADNRPHLYHMDFYVEMKNPAHPTGMERLLVEVKPHDEAMRVISNQPPKLPEKMTPQSIKNYKYAIEEFVRNKHKWTAAQEYARLKGMKFIVVTEKTLNTLF